MKTVWEYSIDTETNRLLWVLKNIASGFYRINGFYPIPLNNNLSLNSSVPIPGLDYLSIHNFWKKLDHIGLNKEHQYSDSELFNEVKTLLLKFELPQVNFQKTQTAWQNCEKEVIAEIKRLIPKKKDYLPEMIIHPTTFGTTSSFTRLTKNTDSLTIFLRHDQSVYAITESILSALVADEIYSDFQGLWQEAEIVVDWLTTRTSIGKILEQYADINEFMPTTSLLRDKQSSKLKMISEEFYKHLGLRTSDSHFSIKKNKIYFAGKTLHTLNYHEQQILKEMINMQPAPLHYDVLGKIIYKDNEEYSLFALNKTIERLRHKLEINGVSSSYIQTVRGFGYLLKN